MIVIQNLKAAILLRQYQALQNRVILEYTAHPTGAHHMKVAAVYDAQQNVLDAFCGGMDPVPNRAGVVGHSEVLATHTSSPLDPSSIPVNFPPAPPTLAPGGPRKVPAGAYDTRSTLMRLDTRQVVMVSGWATISGLPAESSIAVSGMDHYFDNATNTVPPQICQVYARLAGTADLPRQAGSTKTTGATVTIGSDPSLWNPELTLWEWHDAAVQVQGAGALRVVETLR